MAKDQNNTAFVQFNRKKCCYRELISCALIKSTGLQDLQEFHWVIWKWKL